MGVKRRVGHTGSTWLWLSMLLAAGVWLTGCLGPVRELYPEDIEQRPVSIYLVNHGWHVGLIVPAQHLHDDIWPGDDPYMPDSEYLKFGWGERRYYQSEDPSIWLTISAGIFPTSSVLHVAPAGDPVTRSFPASRIKEVRVTEAGMEEITHYLVDTFRKSDEGRLMKDGPGLYPNSVFYRARGLYFVPRTSNVWTARALRAAGCPITPVYAVTAGNVMRQAESFGERIQ